MGSPLEIQTPTHWNLIGSSMTAPPPLLSLNSILPPQLSVHFRKEKFGGRFKNVISLLSLVF
jgi:hypothetical protein